MAEAFNGKHFTALAGRLQAHLEANTFAQEKNTTYLREQTSQLGVRFDRLFDLLERSLKERAMPTATASERGNNRGRRIN